VSSKVLEWGGLVDSHIINRHAGASPSFDNGIVEAVVSFAETRLNTWNRD